MERILSHFYLNFNLKDKVEENYLPFEDIMLNSLIRETILDYLEEKNKFKICLLNSVLYNFCYKYIQHVIYNYNSKKLKLISDISSIHILRPSSFSSEVYKFDYNLENHYYTDIFTCALVIDKSIKKIYHSSFCFPYEYNSLIYLFYICERMLFINYPDLDNSDSLLITKFKNEFTLDGYYKDNNSFFKLYLGNVEFYICDGITEMDGHYVSFLNRKETSDIIYSKQLVMDIYQYTNKTKKNRFFIYKEKYYWIFFNESYLNILNLTDQVYIKIPETYNGSIYLDINYNNGYIYITEFQKNQLNTIYRINIKYICSLFKENEVLVFEKLISLDLKLVRKNKSEMNLMDKVNIQFLLNYKDNIESISSDLFRFETFDNKDFIFLVCFNPLTIDFLIYYYDIANKKEYYVTFVEYTVETFIQIYKLKFNCLYLKHWLYDLVYLNEFIYLFTNGVWVRFKLYQSKTFQGDKLKWYEEQICPIKIRKINEYEYTVYSFTEKYLLSFKLNHGPRNLEKMGIYKELPTNYDVIIHPTEKFLSYDQASPDLKLKMQSEMDKLLNYLY